MMRLFNISRISFLGFWGLFYSSYSSKGFKFLCTCFLLGFLASCATQKPYLEKGPAYNIALEKISYNDLPAWQKGSQKDFKPVLERLCHQMKTFVFNHNVGTKSLVIYPYDYYGACEDLRKSFISSSNDMRYFMKTHFVPYLVLGRQEVETLGDKPVSEGLFTGYFKPILDASFKETSVYRYPLFARPHDLIVKKYHGDNGTLYGRYNDEGQFVRYYTRKQINTRSYRATHKVLLWFKDPIDLNILQVQGSGTINLPSGRSINVAYDGNNGWDYYSISRWLMDFGHYSRDVVSWQFIRKWVKNHPLEYRDMLNSNPRYVFFKVVPRHAAVGAFGTQLTPTRSLAVDKRYIPLGVPLWLDTKWPLTGENMDRLMASEDVGGAIVGPIRGDVYWGEGDVAFSFASHMNYPGRYYILLPKAASERVDKLHGIFG